MTVGIFGHGLTPSGDAVTLPDGRSLPGAASPFVSVSSLVRALRRRWKLWSGLGLLGLILAVGLSLALPPPYSATTVLLLRQHPQSDPARAMQTDAQLVKSRIVAQHAIDQFHLDVSSKELVSQYQAIPASNEVLRITAKGPTASEAVRRARAVAEAFLRFRRDEFRRQSEVVVQVFREREKVLEEELTGVTDRINFLSAGGGGSDVSARELGGLLTRRSAISNELRELRQRADAISLDNRFVVEKSRIADPAVSDDRPLLRTLATNLAAGLVIGIGLGAGWVVVHALVSDRVRRRDEVAAALGAPVGVSVGPLTGSARGQRRRFRRHLREPQRDIVRIVRHLRDQLAATGGVHPALVVVSLGSDGPAALALASTAVELTRDHGAKTVLLADLSATSRLARLLGVAHGHRSTQQPHGMAVPPWVAFLRPGPPSASGSKSNGRALAPELDNSLEPVNADLGPDELRTKADLILALATVDPALDGRHLVQWGASAVAVVTVGGSTATGLRSAAHIIQASGLELRSVVLVGADSSDETIGAPDGSSARPWPETIALPTNP